MNDSTTAEIQHACKRAASAAKALAASSFPCAFSAAMERFLRPLALQDAPAWRLDTRGQA